MINKFEKKGSFLCRDGKAKASNESYSKQKLCFVASDKDFLMSLLLELSENDQCYFVKLSDSARDGMFLGRCFFIEDKVSGNVWAQYKAHPKVFCSVQDDEFVKPFRDKVERKNG